MMVNGQLREPSPHFVEQKKKKKKKGKSNNSFNVVVTSLHNSDYKTI